MTSEHEGAVHVPGGQRSSGVPTARTLPAAWLDRWSARPDHPVVNTAGHGWVTAAELEQRSRVVAGRLAGAGLQRGERLLLSAETSLDHVVVAVAALRLGLVLVPVNPAYGEQELVDVVRDCRPAAVVVDDEHRRGWAAAAAPGAVSTGPDVALTDAQAATVRLAPDDPALLVYTSGTTGRPKGAVLTHGNVMSNAQALRTAWQWTADDRLVLSLPLFHVHGLVVGLLGTLCAGASVLLHRGFDVDDVLDDVREHSATLLFGVPTMYARLVRSPRAGELAALRLCVSGSAPLPEDLFRAVHERAGQRVLERYGMTETLMNTSNPYDGDRRPGSVGPALPGVQVRLDPTSDEVLLRGPNVFAGYWERPDATQEAFTADGWFRTGDVGAIDADGYLSIVGRLKELIITGGYNVHPREVEEVLQQHAGIDEAAVVGRPDPEWGEVVVAYVVGDAGAVDDLPALLATRLAPYKRPRDLLFVEELPRNALGKVVRSRLGTVAT